MLATLIVSGDANGSTAERELPDASEGASLPRRLSEGQTFVTFTSGDSCEANGAGSITTLADCEAAATSLGFDDTTAVDLNPNAAAYFPSYCLINYGRLYQLCGHELRRLLQLRHVHLLGERAAAATAAATAAAAHLRERELGRQLRVYRRLLDHDAGRLRGGGRRARPFRHDGGGRWRRRLLQPSALLLPLVRRHAQIRRRLQRRRLQCSGHEHRRLRR